MKHLVASMIVVGLVGACGNKSGEPKATAATAPPPSAPTATAPRSPEPPAATPAPTPTPTPAGSLVITEKGLGALAGMTSPDLAALTAAFAKHELTVGEEVMELPPNFEAEEAYISVKKGEREVLQIMGDGEVHAVDPMFATTDGIKPGDPASVLADKRQDVTCKATKNNRLGYLTCTSAAEPSITFALDAKNYKGKASDEGTPVQLASLAKRKIVEIVR